MKRGRDDLTTAALAAALWGGLAAWRHERRARRAAEESVRRLRLEQRRKSVAKGLHIEGRVTAWGEGAVIENCIISGPPPCVGWDPNGTATGDPRRFRYDPWRGWLTGPVREPLLRVYPLLPQREQLPTFGLTGPDGHVHPVFKYSRGL